MEIVAVPRIDSVIVISNFETGEDDDTQFLEARLSMNDTIRRLERIFKFIKFRMGLESIEIRYQIGNAYKKMKDETTRDILFHAIIATETLNRFSKEKYLVYDEKYVAYLMDERKVRDRLQKAFSNKEFYVMYQPQYDIQTNMIIGFEALVRWNNTELGSISPARFIPILEESEDILRLGRYVINIIIKDMTMSSVDFSGLRVSINLSSKEYLNSEILDEMIAAARILDRKNIRLCVEITETTLVENLEAAKMQSMRLHAENIEVSIDDFGTGYSSLGYLKNLAADELKVDRMFIKDYHSEDDGNLISAIIDISNKLNIRNLIEGVETIEQLEYLKTIDAERYQGYFGSRPLRIGNLETLMLESRDEAL